MRRRRQRWRLSWFDASGQILGHRSDVDSGADDPHGVLEVQTGAVAQRAALDVVLLRRYVGLRAVPQDGSGAQVVRDAALLVFEVRLVG